MDQQQMLASQRPKFLNLFQIRLPVPGLVSILHRVSGAALFVFAWALLWLLQMTLQSEESFARVRALADHWMVKLFLIGMLWALVHHLLAGIRFLLLDVHIGVELKPTRMASWAVMIASLVLTLLGASWLW
jgi:succinate dehydrogenase / fumarate reductase, cytochrome b subunit